MPRRNGPEQFWARVRKADGDACWEWTAGLVPAGYGHISWQGRDALAHRLSWGLSVGPIPHGLCVLHRCDNRRCVRPDHLFLGTKAANAADAKTKRRHTHGEMVGNSKLSATQAVEIRDMLAVGVPQREIAALFGCSQVHVGRIGRREVWSSVPGGGRYVRGARRGSRHGLAKLSEAKVLDIKRRLAAGDKQRDIARSFGVSEMAISDIKRGARWAHVTVGDDHAAAASRSSLGE